MIPYVRTGCTQRDVQEVENGLVRTFQSLITNPLLNNISIVSNIVVTPGVDIQVDTRLGRPLNGWIVINKTAAGDLYTSPTVNPLPNVTYLFRASANNTFTILFF